MLTVIAAITFIVLYVVADAFWSAHQDRNGY